MADGLRRLAAEIVSSYVENNSIAADDLAALITSTFVALHNVVSSGSKSVAKPTAAQIKKSVKPDLLISFIDGRPYRTLKRHLRAHGMTPDEYRARFGLPGDYPTIARSYSEKRAAIARHSGLGSGARSLEPIAQQPQVTDKAVPGAPVAMPLRSRRAIKPQKD
jgi:predicted transcriptional regulator